MSSKTKKITSWPRRVYTTRKLREITEQNRLKDAGIRDSEATVPQTPLQTPESTPPPIKEDLNPLLLLPLIDSPQIIEEIKTFVSQVNTRPEPEIIEERQEDVKEDIKEDIKVDIKEEVSLPLLLPAPDASQIAEPPKDAKDDLNLPLVLPVVNTLQIREERKEENPFQAITTVLLASILSVVEFFSFSRPWVNTVTAKFNVLIVHASFFILNLIQGGYSEQGTVLNTRYYNVSLQGDLVSFCSLELIVFMALFVSYQKVAWVKKGMIYISLIPLAIIANILRVIVAFGLAFNYGAVYADHYFHGVLVGFIFIFILIGLIFFEFLFFSDNYEL